MMNSNMYFGLWEILLGIGVLAVLLAFAAGKWLFSRWEQDHCYKSWRSEQAGTQLPPDYRQGRTL